MLSCVLAYPHCVHYLLCLSLCPSIVLSPVGQRGSKEPACCILGTLLLSSSPNPRCCSLLAIFGDGLRHCCAVSKSSNDSGSVALYHPLRASCAASQLSKTCVGGSTPCRLESEDGVMASDGFGRKLALGRIVRSTREWPPKAEPEDSGLPRGALRPARNQPSQSLNQRRN